MEIRPRTSDSYRFTFSHDDVDGYVMLSQLRRKIRIENKYRAEMNQPLVRVSVRGREPFVKMDLPSNWIFTARKNQAYDFGGNVVGGLKNASRFDVYVYNQ